MSQLDEHFNLQAISLDLCNDRVFLRFIKTISSRVITHNTLTIRLKFVRFRTVNAIVVNCRLKLKDL